MARPARIAAPNIPNPQTREEFDAMIAEAERSIAEHGTLSIEEFDARRDQRFWREMRSIIQACDEMIHEFNARTGAMRGL